MMIINGRIIGMAGKDYENGYITIDDGKIIGIGNMSDLQDGLKDNVEIIDAKGYNVLPGFVDAHCHLGLVNDSVGFEGADENELTDPVTPHLRAIDGIYHLDRCFTDAIEAGVTTVVTGPGSGNVIGGQFAAIKTSGSRIEEMMLKAPVAMKVAFGENPKRVYFQKKQMPTTRMATAALLRENLMRAKEYKLKLEDYNKDKKKNDKPVYDMKMESLLMVLNREIPLKAHAHRADDIITAIRLAKEFNLKITLEHCTEGYLIKDILLSEGIHAVIGPLLTDRCKIELKNQSLKTPGILSRAGVKVAIMTDHPCVPIQYLSFCAAMAVREGMDENEALKAITINAAEITGIDNRVGSLEKGKDGDIIIMDGNPLDIRTKIKTTIIGGKVVFNSK